MLFGADWVVGDKRTPLRDYRPCHSMAPRREYSLFFDLQPRRLPARAVRRVGSLADDALLVVARYFAEQRFAIRLDVLDRLNPRHGRSEPMHRVPPIQQRQRSQVLAIHFEQIKHDKHGRSESRRLLDEACRCNKARGRSSSKSERPSIVGRLAPHQARPRPAVAPARPHLGECSGHRAAAGTG